MCTTRSCQVFVSLHRMVSLLVLEHFSIVSLPDSIIESSARYSADFFRVIHLIFVVLIHEFGIQGIWVLTQKPDVI